MAIGRVLAALLIGLLILAGVVWLTGPALTLQIFRRLRPWELATLVAAALTSSAFAAMALRLIFSRYDENVSAWLLFRLCLVAFAVGWFVPSGYAAGFPVA